MNISEVLDRLHEAEHAPEKRLTRLVDADFLALSDVRWDTSVSKVAKILADCTLHLEEVKHNPKVAPGTIGRAKENFEVALEEYRRRQVW